MKTREQLDALAQQVGAIASIFNPALGASIQALTQIGHQVAEMVDAAHGMQREPGESDAEFDARMAKAWSDISDGYKNALAKFDESGTPT